MRRYHRRRATRAKARSRSRRRGASWTPQKTSISHFFTRNVIYYTGRHGNQLRPITMTCGGSLPCISSTRPYRFRPSSSRAGSRSTITLSSPPNRRTWLSRIWRSTTGPLPNIPVTRAHPINSQIPAVNDAGSCGLHGPEPQHHLAVLQADRCPGHARRRSAGGHRAARTISATTSWPTSWSRPIRSCRISAGSASALAQPSNTVCQGTTNVYLNGAVGSPFRWAAAKVVTAFRGNPSAGI